MLLLLGCLMDEEYRDLEPRRRITFWKNSVFTIARCFPCSLLLFNVASGVPGYLFIM